GAPRHDLAQAGEGATADEQNVAGIDLQLILLQPAPAATRRHRHPRALDQLQQPLLHAFATDVAATGGVLRACRQLVDLVEASDAAGSLVDIVVAALPQLRDDALDVLADIAGLGQ